MTMKHITPKELTGEYYNMGTTPTLNDIIVMMNEIKAADQVAVVSNTIWNNLIMAGLGIVRTYGLD